MRGPAAGRADLVRVLVVLGPDGVEAVAPFLGLVRERQAIDGATGETSAVADRAPGPDADERVSGPPGEPLAWAESDLGLDPVPFLRVVSVEHLEVAVEGDRATVEPLGPGEGAPTAQAPALEPLAPWSRLGPSLEEALQALLPSLQVDVDEAVRRWSRGERLTHLPRRKFPGWAARLVVVKDNSDRLTPYWDDQDAVGQKLSRVLGEGAVQVAILAHGPGSPFFQGGPVESWPTSAPVLALSDLGLLSGEREQRRWLRWGHELEARGHRLAALVPVPPEDWDPVLERSWHPVWWDRGSLAMRLRTASGRSGAERLPDRPEEGDKHTVLGRLLALLSFVLTLEPGLLRSMRHILDSNDADASLEARIWAHRALRSRPASGATFHDDAAAELGRALAKEDPALVRRVWAAVQAWHGALPHEVLNQESLVLSRLCPEALTPSERTDAEEYARRLYRTVLGHVRDDPGGRGWEHGSWFRRIEDRLPPQLWQTKGGLGSGLAETYTVVHMEELDADSEGRTRADLPPGLTPHCMAQARARLSHRRPTPQLWEMRQVGIELSLLRAPEPGDFTPRVGSLLADLVVGEPWVRVREGDSTWRPLALQGRAPAVLPLSGGEHVEIESDLARLNLAPWTRRSEGPWTKVGRDRFGLWAEAEVEGVTFRLRWIPPGRFLMGSPDDEEGRFGDEGPQHRVTLTQGFWLGEVPVTQALWQAVMKKNPSRFQTPNRPVEQVSWQDCQKFVAALNRKIPGLEARLPTEAEWEYACRAGTRTSTYAGELEIRGEHDGPLLDQIAWYGGNSGEGFELEDGVDSSDWRDKQYDHKKAGSRSVRQKHPNRWGLYDMLGNVWEWCEDGQRDYASGPEVNPVGPSEKAAGRVIRGGSWGIHAQDVRSASRYWDGLGYRDDSLGLRLARGQGE